MITAQNIYDEYVKAKRDLTDVDSDVFLQWVQFVTRFIFDKGKKVDAERFIKTQTYSVVIPPQKESLPTDFQDLNQTACGLYRYNSRKRAVVTFDSGGDSGVTFADSGGTSAYNSNIKVQGGSSRGYTGDAAATLLLSFATNIDWTDLDDQGSPSPNNDYVSIWVYIGNSIPTSATIEFSTLNTGASVGVNQYSYAYTSLVAGWNHIKVLKSAFTTTGSPSWSSLGYLRLIYTGGAASTNVYWDKLDLVGNEVNDYDTNNQQVYSKRGFKDLKLAITGYGRTQEGYYLNGSYIIFTNRGFVDEDYVMRYIPEPPTIDALADYITVDGTSSTAEIVEDRHMEYMLKAIDVLYEQWDLNPNSEVLADQRFVRALGGILESYNRTPQISQIEDYTLNF